MKVPFRDCSTPLAVKCRNSDSGRLTALQTVVGPGKGFVAILILVGSTSGLSP